MKENVLGENELESLKLNWEFAVPGLMTTRCCGTGTCDNRPPQRPTPDGDISDSFAIIYFSPDSKKVKDVTQRYGYLRS